MADGIVIRKLDAGPCGHDKDPRRECEVVLVHDSFCRSGPRPPLCQRHRGDHGLTHTVARCINDADRLVPPQRYGNAYQVERPPPWRMSNRFFTRLPKVDLSVFALAPCSRTMSRVVTRPWSRA